MPLRVREGRKSLQLWPATITHNYLEMIAHQEERSKTQMAELLLRLAVLNYDDLLVVDKRRIEKARQDHEDE